MKIKKGKLYILLNAICILIMTLLCAGCDTVSLQKYDMESYCTKEDASLYDFTEQLEGMESVVATAMYGEDSILICEERKEENLLHRKVWLFSYLTGEKKLCSDHEVTAKSDYQLTAQRFSVLSTEPFVLCDMYDQKIYIYTDDFSDYSVVTMEKHVMPIGMFVREAGFYFMDLNTCKVYAHEMEEFKTDAKELDYEAFRDESLLVFEPDFNTSMHNLDNVSADGKYLKLFANNLEDGEYYYYLYNTQTKTYEEMYQLAGDADVLWGSWEDTKRLISVVPSAVARYEMIDYEGRCSYTIKIEPEEVYSYVQCDTNITDDQELVLFYTINENTETVSELFLWKYDKAGAGSKVSPLKKTESELPVEVDYAELTEKAQRLEEKYGINIIMGENVTCDFDAYKYEQVMDEIRIAYALDELEKAMDAFPDGMCEEMVADYALGFNIYLCGKFSPQNEENISDAGAFFSFDNGYYNLAMNINLDNLEPNLIHEMTHAIDEYFVYCGAYEQLEEDWKECNPDGFAYLESYFGYEQEVEYTFYDDFSDINEVYFVDEYAKTFPTEDRSRVFENFGSEYNEGIWLLESQPLRRKARLLLDYCKEYMECFNADEEYGLKEKAEELGW